MGANVVLANRIDEAFDRPEMNHEVTVEKMNAGMNEGLIIQEQEASVVQDVKASGAGKAELHERP